MFLFRISNKSIKFDSFVTYTKQIIYFCGKFYSYEKLYGHNVNHLRIGSIKGIKGSNIEGI